MKKFIVSMLCASVFFIGLGSLVEKVGATFKSDEKALELIRQARIAIGGDANIASVRSLTITGKATQNFNLEGVQRSEPGEMEINLQLPNQFSKHLKIGSESNTTAGLRREMDVVIVNKEGAARRGEQLEGGEGQQRVFVMKRGEGEPMVLNSDGTPTDDNHKFVIKRGDVNTETLAAGDGKIIVDKDLRVSTGGMRQNELFRTTFALLLSAPEGTDASYAFAGEADVDGYSCNVILAQTGGESFRLYLDKSTSLPRMITYQAVKPLVIKFNKDEAKTIGDREAVKFARRADAMEKAEYQIKFSDFRSVGGLQMPYKWTQTVGGQVDQTLDITNYEVNPANIAEKFQKLDRGVFFRTRKPQ